MNALREIHCHLVKMLKMLTHPGNFKTSRTPSLFANTNSSSFLHQMTSGSAFGNQLESEAEDSFVDASSRLQSRSNSGFSLISTDEEGYFTPASTLSRRSSQQSIPRPTSGFPGRRETPVTVPPLNIQVSFSLPTYQPGVCIRIMLLQALL